MSGFFPKLTDLWFSQLSFFQPRACFPVAFLFHAILEERNLENERMEGKEEEKGKERESKI